MRNPQSLLLWAGLGVALLVVGALTATSTQPSASKNLPRLDAHSSAPDGALALFLWSERLGREGEYLEYRPYELGTDDAVLVALRPFDEYTPEQTEMVERWIVEGGTLLLADDGRSELAKRLGVDVRHPRSFTRAEVGQPLLLSPPVAGIAAPSNATVEWAGGTTALVAAGADRQPVLAVGTLGQGRVWALSMPDVFANSRLSEADNEGVYLNVLSHAREGRVIFDEYHHGRPDVLSLRPLILGEPWGWAFMYGCVAVLLYLVARSRRFGRPVVRRPERARNAGEYVRGVAGLHRRAGGANYLREHYAQRLARELRRVAGLGSSATIEQARRAIEVRTGHEVEATVAALAELERRGAAADSNTILRLVRNAERELRAVRRRSGW